MSTPSGASEAHDEPPLTADYLCALYERHADDLRAVRDEQRAFYERHVPMRRSRALVYRLTGGLLDIGGMGMTHRFNARTGSAPIDPGLDDIEAEITYLRLRERQPRTVVEIGSSGGWSTTWILRALRDNGMGMLHSYDIVAYALGNVPAELATGRWRFTAGDVRQADLPSSIDYLFMDCDHSQEFAEWYLRHLLPLLPPGTPLSIHDIFHPGYIWRVWDATGNRMGEVTVVRKWLETSGTSWFTPSPDWAPDAYRQLVRCRRQLGMHTHIHYGASNPMVFLTAP